MPTLSFSRLTRISVAVGLTTLTCIAPVASQVVRAAPTTVTVGDCAVTYTDGAGGHPNSGVVVTDIGADCVVTFTRAGGTRTTWEKPLGVTSVRVLVVGNGGESGLSGSAGKGGGGGGQVVEQASYAFTSASQNVYVLPYEGGSISTSYFDPATNGLVSVEAEPGGRGSTSDTTNGDTQGGTGGGASAKSTGRSNTGAAGIGTAGLGYSGGNSSSTASATAGGGGGGGACGPGSAGSGTTGGDGGIGCASDITGTSVMYGGGGGGGGGTPGQGHDGGGNGGVSGSQGASGTANLGGGAGGGTSMSGRGTAGDGVVIVRYTPAVVDITPPTLTLAASAASSSTTTIEFSLTGNEPIDCSTLSSSNGVDFTFTNISTINSISQTNPTTCTITATSTAVVGTSRTSTLTRNSSFSVSDTAGNAQTALSGSPASVTVTIADTTAPTLTLSTVALTSNSAQIAFRVIGDEAIDCSTLTSNDFTLTNISVITSIVQTNSTTCTINATSTATAGGGSVTSSLAASGSFSMTDTATTPNAQTVLGGGPQSVSVNISVSDTTPPDASWSAASSVSSLSASYTLTFTESISGLSSSSFTNAGTATGCVFTPSASTGTSVTVSVACTGAGSLIARLNSNAVQDVSNNQGPTTSTSSATTSLTCPPITPASVREPSNLIPSVPTATTSAPRVIQPMAATPSSNTTDGGWGWVPGLSGTARTIDGVTWNFESQRRTSVPSGTQVTIQVSGGVGLQSSAQKMSDRGGANGMFMDNSIVGVSGAQLVTTDDGCTYGVFCPNRGQITISFTPPATDPVLHFSGLGGGGYQSINQGRTTSWTEFQVLTPNARMSVLGQNNLQIVGSNRIEHIVKNPTFNCSNSSNNYGATVSAGCGSFKFSGTYSEIVLQADFNSKNNGPAYFGSYLEDGFTMAVTIPMSQRLVIVTTTAPPTTTSTTVPPTTATPTTAAPTTTPPSTVPGACPINGGSNGGGSNGGGSSNNGGSNGGGSSNNGGGSNNSGSNSSSGGVVDAYAVDGAKDLSVVTPDGPAKVNPFNGLVVPSGGFNESSLKILDPTTKQWVDSYTDSSGTYAVVDGRVIVTPSNQVIGDISMNTFIFKVVDNTGSEVTGSHSVLIAAIDDLPEDLGPIIAEEATDALVVKPGANIRISPLDIFESYASEKFDSSTFSLVTPDGVVDRLAVPQGTWLIKSGELRFIPAPGFMGYVRTDVSVRDSNGVLRTKSVSLYVGSLPTDNLPVTGSYQENLLTMAYFVMMIGIFVFFVDKGRRQRTL